MALLMRRVPDTWQHQGGPAGKHPAAEESLAMAGREEVAFLGRLLSLSAPPPGRPHSFSRHFQTCSASWLVYHAGCLGVVEGPLCTPVWYST